MIIDVVPAELQPAEPAYLHALRLHAAGTWVPLLIGAFVADHLFLGDSAVAGLLPLLVGLIGLSAVTIAPRRIYRRLG